MKQSIRLLCVTITICMFFTVPTFAMNIEGSVQTEFGKPTSKYTIYINDINPAEIKTNKDAACIPPEFGTPTADLPGSGELLTPNLVNNYLPTLAESSISQLLPSNINHNVTNTTRFTTMKDNYYYNDDSIGRLKIPSLDLNVKVCQTTDLDTLKKGVGHFKDTSLWDGNVCIAGHNRGVNTYFSKLHTLENGDKITYTTKLGTRTYKVYSVQKIKETDFSRLKPTGDNILTLITCVNNQPYYRWCVQAKEI